MSLLQKLKHHIETKFPFIKNKKLLIAVSGGVDSVVLTHLCHQLQLNITLAHCNFKLRTIESDADEQFILKLGAQLNIKVVTQQFNTQAYAKQNKKSIQMAARELRYNWFRDLAKQLQFNYILTAHHADDNLETFLINFTRGTGLNGLTGIPLINDNVIRPLLPFSRSQIENYAKKNQINWREDSSNASRKYLRNKLRHDVVPVLKTINPQLLESLSHTLHHLNGVADIVNKSIETVKRKATVTQSDTEITYKISELKKLSNPQIYLYYIFHKFGFTEWSNVYSLLSADSGKYVYSTTHKLTKHREYLILTSQTRPKIVNTTITIQNKNEKIETPIGLLSIKEVKQPFNNTVNTIYVDKSSVQFPLKLRLWQKGDVFQPIGMKGKKKVSKFLKDQKLTPSQKENIWVLTSKNAIIWIVNYRANQHFGVSANTKKILKIAIAQHV